MGRAGRACMAAHDTAAHGTVVPATAARQLPRTAGNTPVPRTAQAAEPSLTRPPGAAGPLEAAPIAVAGVAQEAAEPLRQTSDKAPQPWQEQARQGSGAVRWLALWIEAQPRCSAGPPPTDPGQLAVGAAGTGSALPPQPQRRQPGRVSPQQDARPPALAVGLPIRARSVAAGDRVPVCAAPQPPECHRLGVGRPGAA